MDITIANHPYHNCTVEKREYMLEHPETNPFLNPKTWEIFPDTDSERQREFEALGY